MNNGDIRKSTTTPELFFQIREPHTDKKGKEYRAGTAFARTRKNGDWNVSLVRCSKEDNFCRKQGRTIARRKWFDSVDTHAAVDTSLPQFSQAPTHEQIVALYKAI